MALASGAKLGPYEIQSPLGAGGMGEVYRARDIRLDGSATKWPEPPAPCTASVPEKKKDGKLEL